MGELQMANPAERGGAGARLLLLFAHSFAEGEAGGGVGLDWTPLAPLGTPWAMGAGEKNGTRIEEEGEGRVYEGISLVPPKCLRCRQVVPLLWARLDQGLGHGAGRAQ